MTITLKNNTNNQQLTLRCVDGLDRILSQLVFDLDYVEGTPAERIVMRLSGQSMNLSFTSLLIDSDADLSDGDTIKTKEQQRAYLQGTSGDTSTCIYTPYMADTWTLTINGEAFTCVLKSISIREEATRLNELVATYDIVIGGS